MVYCGGTLWKVSAHSGRFRVNGSSEYPPTKRKQTGQAYIMNQNLRKEPNLSSSTCNVPVVPTVPKGLGKDTSSSMDTYPIRKNASNLQQKAPQGSSLCLEYK